MSCREREGGEIKFDRWRYSGSTKFRLRKIPTKVISAIDFNSAFRRNFFLTTVSVLFSAFKNNTIIF